MKRSFFFCLFLAAVLINLPNCRTPHGHADSSRESSYGSSSDDVPGCDTKRTKPLLALGLWSETPAHCDPEFRRFLFDMRYRFRPGVIEFNDFQKSYPFDENQDRPWEDFALADVIDQAAASTPGCPMIVFNLNCFDVKEAFSKGAGGSFAMDLNSPKITAFEANHVLSNQKLYDATIWYRDNTRVDSAELKRLFAPYFPKLRF